MGDLVKCWSGLGIAALVAPRMAGGATPPHTHPTQQVWGSRCCCSHAVGWDRGIGGISFHSAGMRGSQAVTLLRDDSARFQP